MAMTMMSKMKRTVMMVLVFDNDDDKHTNDDYQAWVCAAKECFLTWSFLGGSLLQLASHNK